MKTLSMVEAIKAAFPEVNGIEVMEMFTDEDALRKFTRECAASVGAKLVIDVRPEDYSKEGK